MIRLSLGLVSLTLLGCPGLVADLDGGADAGGSFDAGEPDAGPFAYDARPPNPTCLAPAPPPSGATVTTARAFANLAFAAPLGLFQAPGDPSRIYVMERDGLLRVFPNDPAAMPAQVTVTLNIRTRVNTAGEGGLLGLAFHPNWPATPELFVSYTASGVGGSPLRSTISRFRSANGGMTFDANSEEKLLELDLVPLREVGMNPYEIMLSESQERMLFVVKAGEEGTLIDIFKRWELDAVAIGEVIEGGNVDLYWHGDLFSSIPVKLLTSAVPEYTWPMVAPGVQHLTAPVSLESISTREDLSDAWLRLLASPNLSSRRPVYHQYDSTVRGDTVIHPGCDSGVVRIRSASGKVKGVAISLYCNS
jgi:hypothetical protein